MIKPSGVDYQLMTTDQMIVTDLAGHVLDEDSLKPSSDLSTHVVLYQSFSAIDSVVHIHSLYATAWAQAGIDSRCMERRMRILSMELFQLRVC